MKTIDLPFLASGKLSPDFTNDNLVIEGENESVEVIASFPPGNVGTVRVYLTTPKGAGEVIEQGDRLSLRSDGTYRLLLTAATLSCGTLRLGFETQYGTQVTRYQTALLTVHSFVSPTNPIGKSGFTLSVEVGNVTSGDVPQVINAGTDKQAVLDFVLPRGEAGHTTQFHREGVALIQQVYNGDGQPAGEAEVAFDFAPFVESAQQAADAANHWAGMAEQATATCNAGIQEVIQTDLLMKQAEGERVDAEGERITAEADRMAAEAQRITAEGERIAAEAARITAETNRATIFETMRNQTVKRYGVRFGGSANTGETVTRLYDAVGLTANVGTDTATATNDFDSIYPWSKRRRCCGAFDANGNFVVTAYKGEPGYTTDGTKGEVWVETPIFYYKHTYAADGSEEIVLSEFPIGGFEPSPLHVGKDGTVKRKAYTAAYPMATVGGKATSRSGVFPDMATLNNAIATARTLGTNYTVTTSGERYAKCLLMWVEFATRNVQSMMNGATTMPYSATDTAVVAESGANRVILPTARANQFVVGQTICIGTALGNSSIANNRIVTGIVDYDASNRAILFDGGGVTVSVGNIVWTSSYKNGVCDEVLSSSGSPASNTDGKHTCVYRGEETPFGNAYEFVSDLLLKREGNGTTTPYTYDIYHLPDPSKYNNGAITADYVKLTYKLPTEAGYIKTFGCDSRYPAVRLPNATDGGSATTYYSDSYYIPTVDVCTAYVGGSWNVGTTGGPCSWRCAGVPDTLYVNVRSRLSYR